MRLILIFTILVTNALAWKNHKACFSSYSTTNANCSELFFNDDLRINQSNNIKLDRATICKKSDFKFELHFHFNNDSVTIKEIDLRKFFHRDFNDNLSTQHNMACVRKFNMHLGEFNRKAKVIEQCHNSRSSFTSVHIINNCREPGNFEVKFFRNKNIEYKGHFLFDQRFYDDLLEKYTSLNGEILNIEKTGIGYTKARYFQTPSERQQGEFYLSNPRVDFSTIHKNGICTVSNISDVFSNRGRVIKAPILTELGKIKYADFDKETQKKSGYSGEQEPLSYIRTPCPKDSNYIEQLNLSPPKGLRHYSPHTSDEDAWKLSQCEYIPYKFNTYSEVLKYNSAFSAFQVDGLYTGLKSNGGDNLNLSGSRWNADLFHLKNLNNLEIEKLQSGLYNLRLVNKKDGVSLFLGNISLNDIKRNAKHFLMGIDPQKLVSNYNDYIFYKSQPLYSFVYNSFNKKLLNQHNLNQVGFEKIWLRVKNGMFIIDLVAHERITPVWRGSVPLSYFNI